MIWLFALVSLVNLLLFLGLRRRLRRHEEHLRRAIACNSLAPRMHNRAMVRDYGLFLTEGTR